ncbi:hypothetical protein K7640_29140 [Micromonospora sp. PLK6-60]|uniref:hypothetical protein n=1 Tax=Micromonospora sp. PLK6-60 TaxID=2873383 RepID=UPI001CA5FEE9|nr:hypothetical protein [Micromonospora sp. PLK6-60]MBY8875901.1 hypothetical protein [Micromonospora sp. PLK6-60]
MDDERRYSVRPGAVELTRTQWTVVGVALAVALVGGVAAWVLGGPAVAAMVLGPCAVAIGLTVALGRQPGR